MVFIRSLSSWDITGKKNISFYEYSWEPFLDQHIRKMLYWFSSQLHLLDNFKMFNIKCVKSSEIVFIVPAPLRPSCRFWAAAQHVFPGTSTAWFRSPSWQGTRCCPGWRSCWWRDRPPGSPWVPLQSETHTSLVKGVIWRASEPAGLICGDYVRYDYTAANEMKGLAEWVLLRVHIAESCHTSNIEAPSTGASLRLKIYIKILNNRSAQT